MRPHTLGGLRFGVIALIATIAITVVLPETARAPLLALLLALTAGIYLGFAWLDARPRWVTLEGIVAVAMLTTALLGLVLHSLFIAAGFLLHVPWDLFHHPRYVQTRIARWVPPACLLYDMGVVVLVFLLHGPL